MPRGGPDAIGRRSFLNGVALAGAVGVAPQLSASQPVLAAEANPPPQPKGQSGYTPKLAAYAAGLRYEDIPPDVLARAKDCIADTVAVIAFGGQLPWSKM